MIDESEVNKEYFESIRKWIKEGEERSELYRLYKAMTPSMQKAVKDIMIVANGGEIDES